MADAALNEPEEWRPVVDHEGKFEVSSHGRVRSLDRIIVQASPHDPNEKLKRRWIGRLLTISVDPTTGYRYLGLGRSGTKRVHVLVAAAFIGPRPPHTVVRHWDGDKSNNCPANLLYGTPLENAQDTVRHGRSQSGIRHWMAILSEEDVGAIKGLDGVSFERIAQALGVCRATVGMAWNSRTWPHIKASPTNISNSWWLARATAAGVSAEKRKRSGSPRGPK